MGIQFENTAYLWLLAVILPMVVLLWWWTRYRNRQTLAALAQTPVLRDTLISGSGRFADNTSLLTLLIAVGAMVVALINPRVTDERAPLPMQGIQVMLALDVSNSMLAADVAPSRLEKARSFAVKLAEALGGSRIGVLAFAGDAHLQMPPSTDFTAVKQALQTIRPEQLPLQGSNIEAALRQAKQSMEGDALAYKAVVLITDGEELEGNARKAAAELVSSGLQVFAVGTGTPEGALLHDAVSGQAILNENNEQVNSRLNEALLTDLATLTNGAYLQLNDIGSTLALLKPRLAGLEKSGLTDQNLVNYLSYAPMVVWVALAALMVHVIGFGKNRLKAKKMAAMLVSICWVSGAGAQQVNAMLEKGMEAYRSADFAAAASAFETALQKAPANVHAAFYLGLTRYRQQEWQVAEGHFANLAANKMLPNALKADVLYNRALCLAKQNRLQEALAAFREVQVLKPADAAVLQNLQKTLVELKKQEQQQKEGKNDKPPMDENEANRQLQSVLEDERKTRERMRPRATDAGSGKNW